MKVFVVVRTCDDKIAGVMESKREAEQAVDMLIADHNYLKHFDIKEFEIGIIEMDGKKHNLAVNLFNAMD